MIFSPKKRFGRQADAADVSSEQAPVIDPQETNPARFTHGDIRRHVFVMASTGAIGLMAVFAVDLLNFYYISHLHDPNLTAAIGFAGSISYIQIALSIGMTIGLGATIGRLLGAGRLVRARYYASCFIAFMFCISAALGVVTLIFAYDLLAALGARGEVLRQATTYLRITSFGLPLVCLGMAQSALLRTTGDARRSMQVSLIGAVVSALLDLILIFGFNLALVGAAISTIISRFAVVTAAYLSLRRHRILTWPRMEFFGASLKEVGAVALPAVATNIATPFGGVFVTHAMARFGAEAISGQTTIDRIIPVAFAFVFALTGSVGPIVSQNYGAQYYHRVRETLVASLKMTMVCVIITWITLYVFQDEIVTIFAPKGVALDIVHLFCDYLVASYFFLGLLFVSNTIFNNLSRPLFSTGFNWGRATLGTIPLVWIGANWGPFGILYGQAVGMIIFGSVAVLTAFWVVNHLDHVTPRKTFR